MIALPVPNKHCRRPRNPQTTQPTTAHPLPAHHPRLSPLASRPSPLSLVRRVHSHSLDHVALRPAPSAPPLPPPAPSTMAGSRNYDFLVGAPSRPHALIHIRRRITPALTDVLLHRSSCSSSVTRVSASRAVCCASARTRSRPRSSPPLASTSRFGPLSLTASVSSCRYGTRPAKNAFAPLQPPTTGVPWASCWSMMSQTRRASAVGSPAHAPAEDGTG